MTMQFTKSAINAATESLLIQYTADNKRCVSAGYEELQSYTLEDVAKFILDELSEDATSEDNLKLLVVNRFNADCAPENITEDVLWHIEDIQAARNNYEPSSPVGDQWKSARLLPSQLV